MQVDEVIDKKRREAVDNRRTLQPFMIIVGSIRDISAIYVIVELIKYKVNSILEAVDLTFKIFFVAHCEYPMESCHIWLFIQRAFQRFSTECKCLTQFEEAGTYIPPQTVRIGERQDYRKEDNKQVLVHLPLTIEFIPLRLVLKKFLELNNMLPDIIAYLEILNADPDVLANVVQGTLWSKKNSKL